MSKLAKSDKEVERLYGIPIYYNPLAEKFYATVNGQRIERDRLADIKRDMDDAPLELKEPVIFADDVIGEMVLTEITDISPHGRLRAGTRAGMGVSPCPDKEDVFPRTEENMKVYEAHKQMRARGWALIHKADEMREQLTPHPKGYWEERVKTLRKARAKEREEG